MTARCNAGGGDWTTAAGDNANDGLTPATPKASIGGVLAAYHLNPGDVIRVDDGTYPLGVNIVLDAAGLRHHDRRLPRRGLSGAARPDRPGKRQLWQLRRSTCRIRSNVTLDHLWVTGGYAAVSAATNANNTGLTVSNSTLFGNSYAGIQLLGGNNSATLAGNTVFGIRGCSRSEPPIIGIQADGNDIVITQNTVYDAESTGIQAFGAGRPSATTTSSPAARGSA